MSLFRRLAELVGAWRAHATVPTVRFGHPWLDRHLRTAGPGDVVVVAARTNVGKSMLTLHMLHDVAVAGGTAVYVSCEDAPHRVGRRLHECGYGHERLLCAFPEDRTLAGVVEVVEAAAKLDPKPSVIAVDYIQLLGYTGDVQVFSDAVAAGRTFIELKAALKRAGILGIVVSQVKRPPSYGGHGGPPPFPSLFDLKDSSRIEDGAEFVLLMGPMRDRRGVVVELAKGKDCEVGARLRMRRGAGGRLEAVADEAPAEDSDGGDRF